MKTLQTAQEMTAEIAKLQYSPSFQIHNIELQIGAGRDQRFGIKFIITYENCNTNKEFYRTFKVEHSSPSFHQTRVKCERFIQSIDSKKPVEIGSL